MLQQLERSTGRRHPDLDGPGIDPGLAYLTEWWRELDEARAEGFNGLQPLSYAEIEAWARLTGRSPSVDEVTTLQRIDRAYRRMYAEESARRREAERTKAK
ncbi:phage tail assembly chaperone [Caldimonas sp. KR1-144]|uniref:phage tail assembly chaperone n=1 Tax=Caldimonas sp. KR1-144 TaxID=3400911 RepID=UPI003C0D27E8